MNRLKDKVAIVTGAGRGIGRAIAIAFSQEGADVVVAARSRDEIKAVAEGLETRALSIPTDVSDPAQIQELVDRTIAEFGRVDILVNNAGIAFQRPVLETTLEEWEHLMNINLRAVFLWHCHVNRVGPQRPALDSLSGGRTRTFPYIECVFSKSFECESVA